MPIYGRSPNLTPQTVLTFAQLLFRPLLVLRTVLIAGGAALIAVYGIVPETPQSLDELMTLFAQPMSRFMAWFCVEGAVVLVCLIAAYLTWAPSRHSGMKGKDMQGHLRMSPIRQEFARVMTKGPLHYQSDRQKTMSDQGISERHQMGKNPPGSR
ncbi:hypothetical protein BDN67DRAFT_982153 [Paxillus ammoniavirescens]|nr:hypothetical protein BDN67DRAFT_982153 [Paxillus ammoniavirescens]